MSAWSDDDLEKVDSTSELQLASRRDDGTLRPYTTMWVVRVGNDLYVRSAGGPTRPWYRHVLASGRGRIRTGGVEREVAFEQAPAEVHPAIDAAYHAKYDRFGPDPVSHVTGPSSHAVTIRLVGANHE